MTLCLGSNTDKSVARNPCVDGICDGSVCDEHVRVRGDGDDDDLVLRFADASVPRFDDARVDRSDVEIEEEHHRVTRSVPPVVNDSE